MEIEEFEKLIKDRINKSKAAIGECVQCKVVIPELLPSLKRIHIKGLVVKNKDTPDDVSKIFGITTNFKNFEQLRKDQKRIEGICDDIAVKLKQAWVA